jgi:hypothetical protein
MPGCGLTAPLSGTLFGLAAPDPRCRRAPPDVAAGWMLWITRMLQRVPLNLKSTERANVLRTKTGGPNGRICLPRIFTEYNDLEFF